MTEHDRRAGRPPLEGPAPNGRGDSAVEELLRFGAILRRHLWPSLIVFAIAFVVVLGLALRQPQLFRAQATLLVQRSTPNVLQDVQDVYALGTVSPWEFPRYMETQASIVRGREIVETVVDELKLAADPTFVGAAPTTASGDGAPRPDAVALLQDRISASQRQDSSLMQLECIDLYPDRASRIVNELADTYVDYNASIRERVTDEAVTWLEGQVDDLRGRVEQTEERLLQLRQDRAYLGASVDEAIQINAETIRSLADAATQAHLGRLATESRWTRLELTAEDGTIPLLPELVDDPVIQSLRLDLKQIQRERADLATRYGDKHPAMDDLEGPEAEVLAMLEREVEARVHAERRGIQAQVGNERSIRAALAAEQDRAVELSRYKLDVDRLQRELAQQTSTLEMLQNRHQQAQLARRLQANNVSVLEYAPVPKHPFRPRIPLVLMVGLIVGLLLGIATALVLDRLDRRIRTRQQLVNETGLRLLGIQPLPRSEANEVVGEAGKLWVAGDGPVERLAGDAPQSVFAECLRTVRTNLQFLAAERPARTVLVTSTARGEGKTAVACNLAITLASTGQKTVLVDTNLRRPRIHDVFDLPGDAAGLTPLLIDESSLDEAIAPSGYTDLDVLPCGPRPPNPSELLGSPRWERLLDELAARYDRIVLDSPPLAAVSDTKLLSRRADALVFVVRQDRSNRHEVRQAMRQLRELPLRIVGGVFNGVRLRRDEFREV